MRLAAAGPKAAFRAEGSEGQRVVGRIESINSNFGFVRLLLTSDEPIPHDQLYLNPGEFGSVRCSLAESRDLGKGLKIEAQAEDGTIEAVSVTGAKGYVVATQWHPEYWVASDGPSQKLFKAFGDAARAYAALRT